MYSESKTYCLIPACAALSCMIGPQEQEKTLSILVIGQSISANCNQEAYPAVDKVYQIDLDGNRVAAHDLFLWADCDRGSVWMPLGRQIVESNMADRVVFMPIGVGGTAIEDWLSGGRARAKLEQAMAMIRAKNIRFDYIFWHQGSSNIGTSFADYRRQLRELITEVEEMGALGNAKWLIARHAKCFGKESAEVWQAQTDIAAVDSEDTLYTGPDTHLLDNSRRFDRCHLNRAGQEEMAKMWFEALKQLED